MLPTIISTVTNAIKEYKLRNIEYEAKRLELYEIPRRNAIYEYIEQVGTVCSTYHNSRDVGSYTSAYSKAYSIVDQETQKVMETLNSLVLERYGKKTSERRDDELRLISSMEEYKVVLDALRKYIKPEE